MQPLQIVRIGAFGDHVFWSSVIPFLQKQHAPIRLEVNMKGLELYLNDPRFSYISCFDSDVYEEDQKRYQACRDRWDWISADCEKTGTRYLNFWSSIENSCVLHEFNADVKLPQFERDIKFGQNFYEKHFEIAGLSIPSGWIHENTLHFHDYEYGVAERWREKFKDSFLMLLALGGSSRQKVFIWIQEFCKSLIDDYPRLRIYLMGGSELARDVWEYERTFSYVNGASQIRVSFRNALLMSKYADYVLGGETGLVIGAGMMGTPKTCLVTLASKDQIVKYHRNDYSLQSKAACSPCHVMAYSGTICPTETTYNAFPVCTTEFDLEELRNIFDNLYCKRF